jgi:hypothetical protein
MRSRFPETIAKEAGHRAFSTNATNGVACLETIRRAFSLSNGVSGGAVRLAPSPSSSALASHFSTFNSQFRPAA